jgi:tyrosyl-DNA phosphodiesterase-1
MDVFYQNCLGKTTQALLGRPKPISFPPIKVVFPSLATVDASILGRDVSRLVIDSFGKLTV